MHNEKKAGAVAQCVRVFFFKRKEGSKAKQRGGQGGTFSRVFTFGRT